MSNNQDKRLVGIVAEFADADSLLAAGRSVYEAGYRKLDAYSPFPIHGIEDAIGIKRTILPFIVLFVGIQGCLIGVLLQWYTNAWSESPLFPGYAFYISGKPMWSLPANIPVIFEVVVLSSALTAFGAMLVLNKLPRLANPLFRIERFKRATNDRFFLSVEADDTRFSQTESTTLLNELGATAVEPVYEDLTDHKLPSFLRTVAVLGLVLILIPPVLIYRAQGLTSRKPRLHFNPDMDFQVKYKPQNVSPVLNAEKRDERPDYLFPDMRAARQPQPGTISRSSQLGHSEFQQGIKSDSQLTDADAGARPDGEVALVSYPPQEGDVDPEPAWVTDFPANLTINEATLRRGQRMYDIHCALCHGYSGRGDGLVNKRALELSMTAQAAWTEVKNLHDPEVVTQPVGRIFDTITNGRATMGPYGSRIKPADRWAIVLYVKALQETIINSDEKYVPPTPGTSDPSGEAADENQNTEPGDGQNDTDGRADPIN